MKKTTLATIFSLLSVPIYAQDNVLPTKNYIIEDMQCIIDKETGTLPTGSCRMNVSRELFDIFCTTPPSQDHLDEKIRLCILSGGPHFMS